MHGFNNQPDASNFQMHVAISDLTFVYNNIFTISIQMSQKHLWGNGSKS